MISLIVAIANNNLIGNGNELPWYYPEDLQYFKKTTLNKTVLMGKKTFLSIVNRLNKPLPKRHNVVATFDKTFTYPNVEVVNNLDEYLKEKSNTEEEVFVIGGSQIYQAALNYATKLYITHIDKDYSGDVYFPIINYDEYNKICETVNGDLRFAIYERGVICS